MDAMPGYRRVAPTCSASAGRRSQKPPPATSRPTATHQLIPYDAPKALGLRGPQLARFVRRERFRARRAQEPAGALLLANVLRRRPLGHEGNVQTGTRLLHGLNWRVFATQQPVEETHDSSSCEWLKPRLTIPPCQESSFALAEPIAKTGGRRITFRCRRSSRRSWRPRRATM